MRDRTQSTWLLIPMSEKMASQEEAYCHQCRIVRWYLNSRRFALIGSDGIASLA